MHPRPCKRPARRRPGRLDGGGDAVAGAQVRRLARYYLRLVDPTWLRSGTHMAPGGAGPRA